MFVRSVALISARCRLSGDKSCIPEDCECHCHSAMAAGELTGRSNRVHIRQRQRH
jgi:hypothetical protein